MKLPPPAKVVRHAQIALLALVAAGCLFFVPMPQAPNRFVAAWGGGGNAPGQFDDPTGIAVAGVAVDPKGNVFAADFYNHRIEKWRAPDP